MSGAGVAIDGAMADPFLRASVAPWEPSSFGGLCAILDNPKWTVARACQAVEECIASNRW